MSLTHVESLDGATSQVRRYMAAPLHHHRVVGRCYEAARLLVSKSKLVKTEIATLPWPIDDRCQTTRMSISELVA
jgi:hypothetical protein